MKLENKICKCCPGFARCYDIRESCSFLEKFVNFINREIKKGKKK